MKLLRTYFDDHQSDQDYGLLKSKGLAVKVFFKESRNIGLFSAGVVKVSIWVLLDHQYEDALRLLEDHSYVPRTSMSFEETQKIEDQAKTQFALTIKKFLYPFFAVLIGIASYVILIISRNH